MPLSEFIADPARRAKLASDTGADPLWLWQVSVAWRGKRASPVLAIAIDRATNGVVPKGSLRPDLWPELAIPARKKAA